MLTEITTLIAPCSAALFLVILGWVSTFYFRRQFLISLLSLEFAILGLFMGLIMTMALLNKPFAIAFYLLVLGACEASLGLSLLVSMTRMGGSDMLSLIGSTKC